MSTSSNRYPQIEAAVFAVIKTLSGRALTAADSSATFFDLGFDSLLLTQASQLLRQKFEVKITFRQLMENLVTVDAVAKYLDEQIPVGKFAVALPAADARAHRDPVTPKSDPPSNQAWSVPMAAGDGSLADRVVKQQLVLMHQQLELLRGGAVPDHTANGNGKSSSESRLEGKAAIAAPPKSDASAPRFGPFKPIDRTPSGGLTPRQQEHLDRLSAAYTARTARSKSYTQRNRAHFADPRSIAGFRQVWKEMAYPIVVKRSSGSRFWDLDNNEYIDVTMGFGTNLFGHSPGFLTRAISNQLRHGVEVGPQSAIAGKVASLMCELTGMERAAFCSTGSEAVLAAVRLARTVSGRTKIATMSGYHGINDEVLVRANVVDGERRPAPVAPGIPQHIVSEVLVLEYGTDESLELLRAHAHELAAVLVEPVQSRRPELQPVEFLREVRKITAASKTALVFDEIITGFRAHPGGTQALFGIKADLATYGKIIGGGMPIGALCGSAEYMDALDGGHWQFGDDSSPEVGMTFFAGTYVRHPLAVRGALSVLTRLKREGPGLQQRLSDQATRLANELNSHFEKEQIPMRITWFRSMLYFAFQQEFKYSNLLFFHLRLRGLHIWEGRPIFLSTAHIDEEIDFIIEAFKQSLDELREAGFVPGAGSEATPSAAISFPAAKLAFAEEGAGFSETKPMEFSLYFFGNYDAAYREDKYSLLKDAAKFGDDNGFTAVWLPERHFHAVGGFSPNSSLLACALSGVTSRIQLRGGSVVLPLHHPVRVAEEWSVADNLSSGRTAISIATGWHPNDFVFAPEAYADRRNIALQNLRTIQRLWRGESVDMPAPGGENFPVKLHPMPRQRELSVWATCIHKESYAEAGRSGLNVLGYLMNQTVDELAEKIAAYREGRRSAGLDPAMGHVTTLLYTYLDDSVELARETARGPLCAYLRSYLDNSGKKIEQQIGGMKVDEEDIDYLTNRSCEDYFNGKSLIGTAESCAAVVQRLKEIGVNEIGCFVDFGIEPEKVLQSLEKTTALMIAANVETELSDATLPLPQAEQGLWLLGAMNGEAALAYRESVTLRMTGELDWEKLAQAIQMVINRHEAVRTTVAVDGQSQTIHARQPFGLEWTDFSELAPNQGAAELTAKLLEMEAIPVPGMEGPFFSAHLLKISVTQHLLVLVFHHVMANGPSYWVVLDELAEIYRDLTGEKAAQLPPVFPFAEFVEKKKLYETSTESEQAESFWMEQLKGCTPNIDLPFDHPLPPKLTYIGDRQELILPAELTASLKKIGAAHRSSLFMVMLSVYAVLLHRLSGQEDIVLAAPFDSPIRGEKMGHALFANTTNMLPLRSKLAEGIGFINYLAQMKDLVLRASEHQDYFFGNLVSKLGLPRDPARAPLFNVVFNLETGEFRRKFSRLTMELETQDVPYRSPRGTAMFDLYLNAAEKDDGEILIQCDHKIALIAPETMRAWLAHYAALLRGVAVEPNRPVFELPLSEARTGVELVVSPLESTKTTTLESSHS